jgi:hypothetical protein
MRQRHRGLANEAMTIHPRRKGTKRGQAEQIAKATPPPPNPDKVSYLAALTLRALTGLGVIPNGDGTVRNRTATTYVKPDAQVIARRRARNKRARIARRAHRR